MSRNMENPLISTQKSSDSGLQAVLHPLVLLTISDYITRHKLRELDGPVVGALLGQQNGREITIEHAFECPTVSQDGEVKLNTVWFGQRLEQMKLVYKAPQLDLVGWYTLLPKSGPDASILPIHNYILHEHNESSLLLAFHPEETVDHSVGSRLPLTIYESNYEADEPKVDQGEDKEMRDGEPQLKLKFRELPYAVETGEAEMISMDFVARGAGNATAIQAREQKKPALVAVDTDPKGKRRILSNESKEKDHAAAISDEHVLSREEEELIASLTAKANAIKMLQSRIKLLITYLERLPPSYLQGASEPSSEGQAADSHTVPSDTILRSIQALVNRLALVVPSTTEAFEQEMLSESNDVNLLSLLNEVIQSVTKVRGIGKKHLAIENAKNQGRKNVLAELPTGLSASSFPVSSGAGDLSI